LLFAVAVAVVFAALCWVSVTAVRLDRARADARRQAVLEENVRLALWRMESALGPLVAQEAGRPYFVYSSFYPAERAYHRMFAALYQGEVLVPSPLLASSSPYVRLHFQYDAEGGFSSPQVPAQSFHDLAVPGLMTNDELSSAQESLSRFQEAVPPDRLQVALGDVSFGPAETNVSAYVRAPTGGKSPGAQQQIARNAIEWQARNRNQMLANNDLLRQAGPRAGTPFGDVRASAMTARWIAGELLLARRVSADGQQYLQGCWLDWPVIRSWLLGEVADLLPSADLLPAGADEGNGGRLLAALPLRLVPGSVPDGPSPERSPVALVLVAAWAGVLVSAGAVGLLLAGALALSERRQAFVSAVTHELRTPLATFRMYTEMLDEGMVPEEGKRSAYLSELRSQAERLGHLVENVLAYARLDGRKVTATSQPIEVSDLLDRVVPQLESRTGGSQMELVVSCSRDLDGERIRGNPEAVERILVNLVDNACKYAAGAQDLRVHLEVDTDGAMARLRVRDHGPGIGQVDARRLFRPFSKSAEQAAASAPGIGLGLSLSRRLAREMGGDLFLEPTQNDGACFVLTLPTDGG
jgi:signal transduction histidine kinase